MFSFLDNFTSSFIVAISLWPIVSALITFPLLLLHYIRFRHIAPKLAAATYISVLYALSLVAFTLYPFPDDNPTVFCSQYQIMPHLTPFSSLSDVIDFDLRSTLQIVANIIFFIPAGIILKTVLGWRLISIAIFSFGTSLTIETAQLTGVFGIYPCGYRLFDIDDLAWNTIGGVVGYLIGRMVPPVYKTETRGQITNQPGLVRRTTAIITDLVIIEVVSVFTFIIVSHIAGVAPQPNDETRRVVTVVIGIITQFILPVLFKGLTPGGLLVGASLDNKNRSSIRRIVYYACRLAYISTILISPITILIVLPLSLICWMIYKKLPYSLLV